MSETNELGVSPEPRKAFVFPTRTLEFLGGTIKEVQLPQRKVTMVDEGAYLWGVDDLKTGKGVFEHVCLVGRKVYWMAKALREKSRQLGDKKYTGLDENLAAELGVCHDAVKIHSGVNPGSAIVGRESLTPDEKDSLGFPRDYREISPEADQFAVTWLEKSGFPKEFAEVIIGHDFPQSEEAIDSPYKQLVQISDYSVAQKFMTVRERWNDVADRWVKAYVKNWGEFQGQDTVNTITNHWHDFQYGEGKSPRIEPDRLVKAVDITQKAVDEIFGYLGMSEEEFTEKYKLNENMSMAPWERVLRKAWERDYAYQQGGETGAPEAKRVREILQKKGK